MQILCIMEIEKMEDIWQLYIKQLIEPNLCFPLPHCVGKAHSTFVAN
jgi:hypothetical protein